MSGPDSPDAPPPEVPEEFAAAYSEAYRRALESGEYGEEAVDEVEPQEVVAVGSHSPEGTHPADRLRAQRWFLPAALTGVAVLLVLGAYGIGKLASNDDGAPGASSARTASAGPASPSRSASRGPSASPTEQSTIPADAWDGPVNAVTATAPTATCTARPSVDSSGKQVRYTALNALDGDPSTAWRCDGSAEGEKLTFTLPAGTELAEVGLIPGYAKTDPKSGADRYVENNRITRVRWTLADGVTVIQNFDPDPHNRAVQTLRVPKTATDRVSLEILGIRRGPRNTTAISEVAFAAAG
jgi:hypothetical protein